MELANIINGHLTDIATRSFVVGIQKVTIIAFPHSMMTLVTIGRRRTMMEEMLFRILVIVLSLILLVVVAIILAEIIAHRKENDSKRFRPKLKYMRPFKEGYAFSDDEDLSKAMQIMYITGDCIEFSDTGLDGKYERIWRF